MKEMEQGNIELVDKDLAYLSEGTDIFNDYVVALQWAQDFARFNRQAMMENVIAGLEASGLVPRFKSHVVAVDCHHNYVAWENHFGKDCMVTRKGAVRAGVGEMGIIPGSMGTESYIVRGKGNADSFNTCSHGAGRVMSRTKAKKTFSLDEHAAATAHVECRKDMMSLMKPQKLIKISTK